MKNKQSFSTNKQSFSTNKLATFLFLLYQNFSASRYLTCRYQPTCSRYAYEAIIKYGLLKGLFLATKRIFACHPFSTKPIYDPV